jgi:serine/threonine protein kinase
VKDYRVEGTLAQHPHSRVYAGRSSDETRVAIKELLFNLVPTIEQVDAFSGEAAFLRGLHNRHTPRFIEAFSVGEGVDTRLYLVQEFIEGESLLVRLQREPLSGAAFDDVATQVLETLIALHNRTPRIIHRDIKPANLVFRSNGELVLVDFGSARHLEQAVTFGSTMVGTVGYMPPEQLGGTIDESSDLHALGASLLHASTGKAPTAFLVDGMNLAFGTVSGLSPKQNEFLARLTAPKRAGRFLTAREALRWLRAPHRPARRELALLAVAGLVGLLGLVASTVVRSTRLAEVAPQSLPGPASSSAGDAAWNALLEEARSGTRALWTSEASYFAERNRYTDDFAATGFTPDVWCPDGARTRHTEQALPGEAAGCHFLYGVIIGDGVAQQRITVYARGAIEPVRGKAWVTTFQGPSAGIPEEWTNDKLLATLASPRR